MPIEINFSPTRFNIHEIGAVVDLAYELGAYSFYTGRTMYTGNAVKAWRHLEVSDEQYEAFFDALRAKAEEYRGRMRVYFHEAGLLEELRYRLREPAALVIVLPNGLVKLINALPFVCGDLRRESLAAVWANFQRAWRDPRVADFVDDLARDPGAHAHAAPMGPSLTAPDVAAATRPTPLRRVLRVVSMVRYRFFLYAGLLPYLLGAAWAWSVAGTFDAARVLERAFPASCCPSSASRRSTNTSTRAWAPTASSIPPTCRRSPTACFWCGVVAFAAALAVGVYLTLHVGWPIIVFALLGGMAAIFYEAPPIRWCYRGLGELVIALSYGPWMVLGSLYLHTRALSWGAFAASLVPGLLIMSLAVVNAIPDYHQDLLVGKRNLVVRLGRAGGVVALSLARRGGARRRGRRRAGGRRFPPRAWPRCSRSRCSSRARAARAARTRRRAGSCRRSAASSPATPRR